MTEDNFEWETADCKHVTILASEYERLKKLDENVKKKLEHSINKVNIINGDYNRLIIDLLESLYK